ncbi:EamA family transporter [Clostridium sp. MCC353]|uniref:DMT family transporter n=1 Tax=Clostridium sp. MCC353 TaxID=2592646 RepID=UPI001C020039|nr:DMT family transporter [Clostridium sp. MCC353]MBT9775163.1 EamA family transporter [Clostridium sp. MCC353]
MNYFEKHPMIMIVIGIIGISLSAIFVKYSQAPSVITAAYRLLWTVLLMSPVVLCKKNRREELIATNPKTVALCAVSGIFLALHFAIWFESLNHTSVASSTTIVCTEVIWVALGFCLFMKGKISKAAVLAILITIAGSILIALSDSSTGGGHLYGDVLAFAAAVSVAVYTLIGRVARTTTSTTIYTYIVYIFSAITLVLIAVMQGLPLTGYGSSGIIVGLLLSIFSTILGHSIFSWCLKFLSPAFVSASKLCEPVVAALFAVVLFQEIPKPMQILGGVIIIGGVVYYSRIESR